MTIVGLYGLTSNRYSGVTEVLQRCYSFVTVVLQWCHSGVTVVLQWCYSGVGTGVISFPPPPSPFSPLLQNGVIMRVTTKDSNEGINWD
jgi:hypothetical protein